MRCPYFVPSWGLGLALLLGPLTTCGSAEIFPYVAYVTRDETPVRSGPDDDFYETERLARGAQVEVYRHDEGDWCAIRPPADSFSWVAAAHLERTPNPLLARVIDDAARTRVGSRFNDIHDVEYITLQPGELLQVLGSKTLEDSAVEPQLWYKVAPPAGEFRWIATAFLSREPTSTTASAVPRQQEHDGGTTQDAGPDHPMIAPGVVKTYPLVTADQASSHAPEAATPSIAAVGHERIDAAWHDVKPQQNETLTDRPSEDWAVTASADVLTAPEPRDFRQRLDDLNLALSRTVLADVDRWELAPLRTQAEELRERSQSSEERFSVESLLQKINEFQSLQSRRRQLSLAGSSRESLAEPGRLPSFSADAAVAPTAPEMPRRVESGEVRVASAETAAPPETMPAVGPMVDDDIFDASGLLISVVSRKAGLPRFALTDPQGRVLHFVTPAEGIDLRQFVGRRVGVIGRPGYIRQYRKPHVTARRVVLLQR